MTRVDSIQPYLEPVRKSIVVPRTPAEAFDIFTARFGAWWPRHEFSLYQAESADAVIEPRVGGRVYETSNQGEAGDWGWVTVWEPPHRFAMRWHPGTDPAAATEVELRFVAVDEGTRVELEHRDWTRAGEQAAEARRGYDQGWVRVFEQCYREACA